MQTTKEKPPAPDILLVDDTPADLQFLAVLFNTQGFQTRAAMNGELALMAIQVRHPDLILMDVNMPDISGIDLCKRIKTDPALRDIPIIFVSGEHQAIRKVTAFAAGGVDYITRPFQIDELISRVTTHINLKQQKEQLRNTMLRMTELKELKDGLIHMIIHDLRNPLFVIDSYLNLIATDENRPLAPETAQYIRETQVQTNIMIELINSILDVDRMEKGPIQLSLEPCDLALLCQQVLNEIAPLKQARSLTLSPSASSVMAPIDKGLIRRILVNLITNAIRATPDSDGKITLRLEVRANIGRISVRDNGHPIPVAEHTTIFDKYARLHPTFAGSGRFGTGLSLPFCKLAVEAHGGQIGVQSQPDDGNIFWLELPLADPTEPAKR